MMTQKTLLLDIVSEAFDAAEPCQTEAVAYAVALAEEILTERRQGDLPQMATALCALRVAELILAFRLLRSLASRDDSRN